MKKLLTLFTLVILNTIIIAQNSPTILASDLSNGLIGVEVDQEGTIWICEMGTGNDDGKISTVDQDGNVTVIMTSLPSAIIPMTGEVSGPYRTKQLADNKMMIVIGEGAHEMAESVILVDKSNYSPGNPINLDAVEATYKFGDFVIDQGFEHSNPFDFTLDSQGNLYIADAASNSILKLDLGSNELSVVVTLDPFPNPLPFGPPFVDPVPTSIIANPGGGFFVSRLSGFPFIPGEAKVYNLDEAGNLSMHADLFNSITHLAVDPTDGNLCVLEFALFEEMDWGIGTASALKLYPDGSRDTIATGIGGLAPSFSFDQSGNLYIVDLAFGQVLKYASTTTSTVEQITPPVNLRTYPNPFREETTFEFTLDRDAEVKLSIYNPMGQLVFQTPSRLEKSGKHSIKWNVNDQKDFNNGLYFYQLSVGNKLKSGVLQLNRY